MRIIPSETALLNNYLQIIMLDVWEKIRKYNVKRKKTKQRIKYLTFDYDNIRIKAKRITFGGGDESLQGIEAIIGVRWFEITNRKITNC